MNTVLVAANGVLHDDKWKTNDAGRVFLTALSKCYRVAIGLDHGDVERFNMWARLEGMAGLYNDVIPDGVTTALRGGSVREGQLEALEARGYDLALLIDNDPESIAMAMKRGVSGLLYCSARFQRVEFRPDYVQMVKPWGELVEEIETQRTLVAEVTANNRDTE